ncbi:MAG: hypothetical protein U1E05_10155 [Patescibacteria group bacterium]|nr:hypothetical protein [Patescibacteria group bacterium]
MSIVRWLIGGMIGGAIGVAIWVAIGYFTGYEVGYVAWGIGFLAGVGVRAGAQQDEGFGPGAMALVLAVAAILVGKYMVVSMHAADFMDEFLTISLTDDDMIALRADAIAQKITDEGGRVNWPSEELLTEDSPREKQFPPAIWAKGKAEWESLSADARAAEMEAQTESMKSEIDQHAGAVRDMVAREGFKASFSAIDLLWFFLAAITAFKLGSGTAGAEE